MRHSVDLRGPGVLPLVAALCAGLLAGCTGDPSPRSGPPAGASTTPTMPSASSVPTAPSATFEPAPAPLRVRVTRVAGGLGPRERDVLAGRVRHTLTTYVEDAYLGGRRGSDFSAAFATFTPSARALARHHRGLLTNAGLGAGTEPVFPRRQVAWLAVLAPRRVVAGVSARVRLRYLVPRAVRADQEVAVRGRLLLTRGDDGAWKIFGYDVARSVRIVGEGR